MSDWLTPEEWTAVRLSLIVATTAMLASLPLGLAAGWLLARERFWGKSLLDAVIHLPLIMPPVVTGYLLLIGFGRRGPIGQFLYDWFGIVLSFRWTGAALACAGDEVGGCRGAYFERDAAGCANGLLHHLGHAVEMGIADGELGR